MAAFNTIQTLNKFQMASSSMSVLDNVGVSDFS